MKKKSNQLSSKGGVDKKISSKRKRMGTRFTDNAGATEQQDRISALPRDMLCCILTLLTVRDAARTTLLSKEWKPLFSSPGCQSDSINDNELWDGPRRPSTRLDWDNQKLWRVRRITTSLQRYKGRLHRFIIQKTRPHQRVADLWLRLLSMRKAIQDLILDIPRVGQYLRLSHFIFSYSSLRSLTLSHWRWPRINANDSLEGYSSTWMLHHLTELTLSWMDMTAADIEDLLRRCPGLLSLSISYLRQGGSIAIRCGNLQSLTIGKSRQDWNLTLLVLEAPMLERLLWCHPLPFYNVSQMQMAETPRLHTIGIYWQASAGVRAMTKQVRTIAMAINVDYNDVTKRTMSMLFHLPHLETLHLEIYSSLRKPRVVNFGQMIDGPAACLEKSLKTIVLRVKDLVFQKLAFTNFLLGAAKVLNKMYICGKQATVGELLCKERRGSKEAQVVFLENRSYTIELEITASNIKSADPFMP
ncbi:hypothetical protein ACP70R_022495 [Stipagrostis hirtigluma subsp. patula]